MLRCQAVHEDESRDNLSIAVAMPWPGGIPQQEEINADGTTGGLVGLPLLQPLSRYRPPARPVVRIARPEVQVARQGEGGLKKRQMQDVLAIVRDSSRLQRDMAAARDAREGREEESEDDDEHHH